MTSATLAAHRQPARSRWTPVQRRMTAWRRKAALAAQRAPRHILGAQATVRRLLFTAVALGFIDACAFGLLHLYAGFGITGLSLLVFNECMN